MSVFHVSPAGADTNNGSPQTPFRTINRAVAAAQPGDTVRIHTGTYREWVKPCRTGRDDERRIIFEGAPGETRPVITGAERIRDWTHLSGTTWTATVDNAMFGTWNPFAIAVEGDWTHYDPPRHLGQVYLNGVAGYEVDTPERVHGDPLPCTVADRWTGTVIAEHQREHTGYLWHAEVGDTHTTIWANFRGADPREELVEINVRRSVLYPDVHHINYITVRGLELCQAATPWTPPTADQPGLIGPNWAKGWIIEDCDIHDASCSAVSLGKENSSGNNWAAERQDKSDYQYQLESVFNALRIGWDKALIGSHIVRRNHIHHCGQNAVVGHLGGAFSRIEDNHIHHIATKREFYGYEIAGIKLHAPIDTVISHNLIEHCTLGIWLDWQAQGTRVTRNIMRANARDLFVEVSHGPYLVDHNVLASAVSVENLSQGGAYIHNLFLGVVMREEVRDRPTPYHLPHSTQVAGFVHIRGGDDRYIGNIFMAPDVDGAYAAPPSPRRRVSTGTAVVDGHPASHEGYDALMAAAAPGDVDKFCVVPMPVTVRANAYINPRGVYEHEADAHILPPQAQIEIERTGETLILHADLRCELEVLEVNVSDLGRTVFADQGFGHCGGSPVDLSLDLCGDASADAGDTCAGPLGLLRSGMAHVELWSYPSD